MVSQRSLCSVAQRVQYLCVMGPRFFRFANTIFLFQRHLENNCLHSRRTQGADESRIHSSTYCSLHSVHEWKKTLLPLPYPFAHRALPNISSEFPCKNSSSLSYTVSWGTKQAFQYSDFNLLCITTFTFPSSFFCSLYLSYFFLILFLLLLLCLSVSFQFVVFPFLCFFSMRKGRCSTLGQLIIEAWRGLAEIIAHVWLCRQRARVLLLWGFPRSDIGAVPTVYSKRTAVLMQVQQGEGHLLSGQVQ